MMMPPASKYYRALWEDLHRWISAHYESRQIIPPPQLFSSPSPIAKREVRYSLPEPESHDPLCFLLDEEPPLRADAEQDPFDDIFRIFAQTHPSPQSSPQEELRRFLSRAALEETFTGYMLRVMAEKGLSDPDVYRRVFMDRRLFNRIRSKEDYQPSKSTALLLALALRLSVPQTQDFLSRAGYSLNRCSKTDLIVEYFLLHENYDIFALNEMLHAFGLPLLMKCD